jgi:hypothetical protein
MIDQPNQALTNHQHDAQYDAMAHEPHLLQPPPTFGVRSPSPHRLINHTPSSEHTEKSSTALDWDQLLQAVTYK